MRRDTIFRIASMTKPFTAAATMILVEEGALRPDGPLDDTVPAHRPITVRDLLTFRMGLGIVMVPPSTYPIQAAMDEQRLGQGPPAPSAAYQAIDDRAGLVRPVDLGAPRSMCQ